MKEAHKRYARQLDEADTLEANDILERLSINPDFSVYRELVDGMLALAKDQAIDGPVDEIPYWKGYVSALKDMCALPATIKASAESIVGKEEARGRVLAQYQGSGEDSGDASF